jgi:lipid-A-disaccharide synthase
MKIAIVAGEASGDLHAAEVVAELKKLDRALDTFGIGGDLLEREGMRVLHHAREMGIVGLFNVLRHIGMFRRIFKELIAAIAKEKPDAVLLVDYPGFNLRVAQRCKEMGLRVIYYISPQVWAWRRGRVRHIAKYVDHMLVIFPFEEQFYKDHDVKVTYVGHPLIDEMTVAPHPRFAHVAPRPAERGEGGRRPGEGPLNIALLPGSRRSEINALLPPMLDAVALLKEVDPFIIQAPTISSAELLAIMERNGTFVRIVPHDRGESLASADLALSSSGTATLECAIAGTPVVVVYRLSPANYWLAKRVVTLPHFSLINIIAGRQVVPELLQHDVNGERIAQAVRAMIAPAEYDRVRRELAEVREKLGAPGASRRAAEVIMRTVRE